MLRSLSTLSTDDSNILPQTKSWTRLLTKEIISQVDLEKELKELFVSSEKENTNIEQISFKYDKSDNYVLKKKDKKNLIFIY